MSFNECYEELLIYLRCAIILQTFFPSLWMDSRLRVYNLFQSFKFNDPTLATAVQVATTAAGSCHRTQHPCEGRNNLWAFPRCSLFPHGARNGCPPQPTEYWNCARVAKNNPRDQCAERAQFTPKFIDVLPMLGMNILKLLHFA